MEKLVNLTPHKIVLLDDNKEVIKELESQWSIRLSTHIEQVGMIDWISITRQVFWNWALPEEKAWTKYIVSLPVAKYAKEKGREDFLIPGEVVRSEDRSKIIWMKSLAVI